MVSPTIQVVFLISLKPVLKEYLQLSGKEIFLTNIRQMLQTYVWVVIFNFDEADRYFSRHNF